MNQAISVKRLKTLANAGHSQAQVARMSGVTRQRIFQLSEKYDIQFVNRQGNRTKDRPTPKTDAVIAQLKKLGVREGGLIAWCGVNELREKLGCGVSTLYKAVHKMKCRFA